MKPRPPFCFSLAAVAAWLLPVAVQAEPPSLPTNEEVREILRQRIDVEKRGVSIVVGLVDASGSRVIPYGQTAKEGSHAVDGQTIYEIGSVTKMFTDLVLADMLQRNEAKLDDPIAKYLPKDVKVPARNGREITLLDLVTHRSSLPRMPGNFHPADPANPYADYTPAQLYAFLSGYELPRDIGSKMEYSNLGVGLLGYALALRAGQSYEELVTTRVCQPLGMGDTSVTPSEGMRQRLALPYDETLLPAKNWDIAVLTGAGGLRSSADDMTRFVAAELGLQPSPLAAAMQDTQKFRVANSPQTDMALGWFIDKRNAPPIWWHNGGTAGYHAFVGFRPATKTGVVVLANTGMDIDDLGQHLLDRRFPLTPPPKAHTAVAIRPELADRYAGRYQITPKFILTFSREGDRYFLVATDQPRNEVFPESEADFFAKGFDAQITFVKDAQGNWSSLVLHQGGIPDQTASRLP